MDFLGSDTSEIGGEGLLEAAAYEPGSRPPLVLLVEHLPVCVLLGPCNPAWEGKTFAFCCHHREHEK